MATPPVTRDVTNRTRDFSIAPWLRLHHEQGDTWHPPPTGLPRQIHLGMRMGTRLSRLAYNPNLPAMAPDSATSRSKGRLLYARRANQVQESIPGNVF